MSPLKAKQLHDEVQLSTARSGGPGGQHVNKVETKVLLRWNIGRSEVLNDREKQLIRTANASKVTKEDELLIIADSHRSQLKNREIAFKKLDRLIAKALTRKKPRKPTEAS